MISWGWNVCLYVCVACINIQPNITVVQYSCSRQRDWLVLNPCLWQKREKNDAQKTGEQQAEAEQESEDEDFEVVESDDEMPAPAAERPTFSLGAVLQAKEVAGAAGAKRKSKRKAENAVEDDRLPGPGSASGHLTTPSKPKSAASALATPPSKPRGTSRSRSPGMVSSKKKGKGDKDQLARLPSAELEELDEAMKRVEKRCGGPPKPCLRALVVERHLAGEKLGVRLQAAGS